ncbi:MAG: twin-arginine translocation signal domain-containing protein [Caldilineaceae bacterium]|nr:twin-arginine translocation signal domain-containing protein [Caldilineaceae bacterium]
MPDYRRPSLSRRDFLRASSFLALGGVLAACAAPPGVEQAAQQAEQAQQPEAQAPAAAGDAVQYWVGWGNLQQSWDAIVQTDEWAEWMGDTPVELKSSTSQEAILTAVAAGTPPDGASNTQYLDYMARGVLQPIDDWIATSEIIKQENYLEGSWNDGFYQGVMYGVPANEGFIRYGLNYNARMVEEAGLDPDTPPETWSECMEWHKALTKFDDAGNMLQVGLDPYDAMGGQIGIQDGFYPPPSWGWTWFDAEAGTFDLDNEMMVQAFEVMGEFIKLAGPDNMAGMRQVEGQGGWGGSFNAEVQAMLIEGYWHPGETQIQKPEVAQYNRATWAPVPDARKGVKIQGTGGHYVILFKDAKRTQEMFRAAEFLNTDTAMSIIFENTGWLPGHTKFLETIDPSVYPGLDFYVKSVAEATEWTSPARCPITQFVSQQYQQLREAQFREEMTAAEAAAEFQKRCDEEYKNAGFAS